MKIWISLFFCTLTMASAFSKATLVTYDWPTDEGQAVLSDKYRVSVSNGRETLESEVLLSESWDEPGGGPDVFRGRTFSWTAFNSSYSSPVTITVEKLFGEPATEVEVFPSGYGIEGTLDESGYKVSFTLQKSRYVSVNFKTACNLHANEDVVKHMMMVFADPIEQGGPDLTNEDVLQFTSETTQAEVDQASKIYIGPGYYDFKMQFVDGVLELHSNMSMYIAGGAFIAGKLLGHDLNEVEVRGRGVLSGRDWDWVPGLPIAALIDFKGERISIEGIVACDNDMHGIVPGNDAVMENVKLWGWHYNNDGFRPWGGKIEHCFIRPTDDAFYVGGSPLVVSDTVIWQSFNGAVVTCGWGSEDNPYDTKDFEMTDCHILYPEWNSIGNNNGILASQLPYSASSRNITFKNIRVDGNIVAITNLKRNEKQGKTGIAGGISNVSFENLWISGQQLEFFNNRQQQRSGFSRIRGDDGFRIENISFRQVSIGGVLLDESNVVDYFDIDPETTSEITFESDCSYQ